MLMAPFYACKIVEIHHQIFFLITSLIFILFFSKKLDKVIVISKIKLLKTNWCWNCV
jgi:hypothetical protein